MNIKKIGLSALAGSLVAVSANAGEMSVAGSASLGLEHTQGGAANTGKTFSMGNQLTFTGSGELDNGMNVSLSFILDQGDDETDTSTGAAVAPFDSHSLTVSSEGLGTLVFHGEGGSSAQSAIDGSAAGDIWDSFDGDVTGDVVISSSATSDNMLVYTLPTFADGLSISASYVPTGSAADSATSYAATYSGIEGLSVSYGVGDGNSTANDTDATSMKASYAYGPVTVAYSNHEFDTNAANGDQEMDSYKLSYTVSDELSISYGAETIEETGHTEDTETSKISISYTAGGMTLTASSADIENSAGGTGTTQDRETWALGASFAF